MRTKSASVAGFAATVCAFAAAAFLASPSAAVDGPAPPQLAIVVPLTAPVGELGLITASALAQLTAPTGLLTQRLNDVVDRPVTIAIDPMIIASIRVLGSAAPESALAWLDRLRGAKNDTFALGFADTDVTLALQAGSAGIPGPIGFDYAIDASNFTEVIEPPIEPIASPTSSSTSTPEAPSGSVVPSLSELLEWPYTLTNVVWPAADTVSTPDLAALLAAQTAVTLLADSNVDTGSGSGSAVMVNGVLAAVTNASASEALQETNNSPTTDAWQQAFDVFVADITTETARQPGTQATVVATLDRVLTGKETRLSETLAEIETRGSIVLVPLSTILKAPTGQGSLVEAAQPADRLGLARSLISDEVLDAEFASVVEDQTTITADRRNRLLALLSASWSANPTGWSFAMQRFATDSQDLRSSVQLVDVSNINFFADRQSIQIPVSNSLDVPVRVLVEVSAQRPLLFIEQSPVEIVIEPGSQKNAPIPVQSVSNGTVQLTVTLASATGVPIGEPSRVSVNVQAGWDTPVVTALAVLAVAVFVIGLIRNILRRRRQLRD